MKNNPYVGPRPYEREDRRNFYGRQREARDLTSLILAERVVLFYAPSGAGKTSLLNAQVIPALEENDFNVLPTTRVGSELPPEIDPDDVENVFVFSALMGLGGGEAPAEALLGHTLLSFLRQHCLEEDAPDYKPPIVIFDQFEEILTTHRERWQDARGFFEQMRDALRGMPTLGVVLAMREDHVAGLDPYAPLLPRRLRARFRMERLDRKGALEAVKRPAQEAGCPFDPGVAERLVDDLCRIKVAVRGQQTSVLGPFVEPVQLQVVCHRLWENLPEQEDNAIQWEEVEEFGNIDRALIDFYESALVRCVQETEVSERWLRRWFGERLITPMQTRGLVLRGEHETGGLPNEAVDVLEAQYLIRADVRAGARWYELSHDRLVDPILQSNQAWEMARQTPLLLAARRWRDTGRDPGILYRGKTLEEALAWAKTHPSEVEPYEREFLKASQQAEQVRKRMRNLRIFGAVMALLLIVGVTILNVVAYRAGRIARSKAWASNSIRYRSINQEQSIILARLAVDEAHTVDAEIALRQAIIDFYPSQVLESADMDHVCSVAYSPDGRFLAVYTADGLIQIWDTTAQSVTLTIEGAANRWICWGLTYSPDGRFLATSGDDNTVRLWDTSTGLPVTTLIGHMAPVYSLAYSPDGRFIASGSHDGIVRVWNLSTASPVITLTGHTEGIPGLAYSHDGRLLASGSWDGTVRLWEITATPGGHVRASPVVTLTEHTAGVNDVAFSPDGEILASASSDKTIRLWDVATGEAVLTLVGHQGPVMNLSFSADGRYLISGSRDATVRVWDAGLRKSESVAVLTGHTSIINDVAYSPAGRFLASGSADRTVRIWDSAPPQGSMLRTFTEHTSRVTSVVYSPDGEFLASGDADGTVRIWSATTCRTVMTLPVGSLIWWATYSPDGRYVVTCSADDFARVWDVANGPPATLVVTLTGHTDDVNGAAYSPDGRFLVTVSDDKTVRIWDTGTWETVRVLEGHTGKVNAVAYSPDGRFLASGDRDNEVRIWDAETGAPVATLRGHEHMIYSLMYSPDGRFLASASWDKTARIWDTKTYTTMAILVGHTGYVYDVEYSPDGRYLATSSWDRTVRLWDLSQSPPKTIAILIGHTDYIPAVAYSPDGQYIASGSRDGTVRRYLARFEDVERLAEEYVPRKLTAEEQELLEHLVTNPFNY